MLHFTQSDLFTSGFILHPVLASVRWCGTIQTANGCQEQLGKVSNTQTRYIRVTLYMKQLHRKEVTHVQCRPEISIQRKRKTHARIFRTRVFKCPFPNTLLVRVFLLLFCKWVQGWRSGESIRLLPMWPGFDSQTGRHMWVEFVGCLLCTERFLSGYSGFPSPQKPTFDLI